MLMIKCQSCSSSWTFGFNGWNRQFWGMNRKRQAPSTLRRCNTSASLACYLLPCMRPIVCAAVFTYWVEVMTHAVSLHNSKETNKTGWLKKKKKHLKRLSDATISGPPLPCLAFVVLLYVLTESDATKVPSFHFWERNALLKCWVAMSEEQKRLRTQTNNVLQSP